jgi:hypothetical protein
VNVREWVASRSLNVPESLTERVIELLGTAAFDSALRAGPACLSAAQRSLSALLASGRTERDMALDLLAIDALTTFAFEHASEAADAGGIKQLATEGARAISGIGANG